MTIQAPQAFLQRMASILGDEFASFLASYNQPPVTALRANTLKISPEALRARLPFELQPVPWSTEAFVVSSSEVARPGKHPYHAAGLYYLQDPSALAPVELLDPQPGEFVLDLAAAPGGKSTHIAARLAGQGLLVANEVVHKRAWELAGNLERWGATNVAITNEAPGRLAERLPGFFDAVLVDAPCSGEGMFRKSAAARQEWAPSLVEGCALRQEGILRQAAALIRPGGRLVYSTCTFAPEENEATVARFLDGHPEFSLAPPPKRPGFSPGRPDWVGSALQRPELALCVRLWPHQGPGEGHFAALLAKNPDEPGASGRNDRRPASPIHASSRLPTSAQAATKTFIESSLRAPLAEGSLALMGSYLYAIAGGAPDLTGLRFLHPGWWLGEVKKGRFEPSHALALGLQAGQARRTVEFTAESVEAQAYLRGETVPVAGEDGWTLVAVDGYPLGWGKVVSGRLKSHYPKGLRWIN